MIEERPISWKTPFSDTALPIRGHYWAKPTNKEPQIDPLCKEVWSYNSVWPKLVRPPQCIRGAVRSLLIGRESKWCLLIGCEGQASWHQLSNITRCLSGARVGPPSLYLLCHWSPDHCNLTRAGSDMWSNLSSQHQPIRGLYPALLTNERLELCDIWPMRGPCRNVSIAMISYRWQKLDNNEWGKMSLWQQLCEIDLQKYKIFWEPQYSCSFLTCVVKYEDFCLEFICDLSEVR